VSALAPVPPQNLDAEESVLGAMMLSPGAIDAVQGVVSAGDFYRESHGVIFDAALALQAAGKPVDVITLVAELRRLGKLEDIGGQVRVCELAALVPAARNAVHYAQIVREMSVRRGLIRVGSEVARLSMDGVGETRDLVARARELVAEVGDGLVHSAGSLLGGADFVFGDPEGVEAIWGSGDQVLWSAGEPLFVFGRVGIGKTTLGQQLVLRRCGVIADDLLGLPVAEDDRPTLYVAADRPRQARQSLRRMVSPGDEERLTTRLLVQFGPPPFDVLESGRLAAWALQLGVGTLVLDSLKDFAVDIERPETGARVNQALQQVVLAGIEVLVLHHPRKSQPGSAAPTRLDDLFGSAWIAAGAGSVVLIDGKTGGTDGKLVHLKQPAAVVGPINIVFDRGTGGVSCKDSDPAATSSVTERVAAYLANNPKANTTAVKKGVPGRDGDILSELDRGLQAGVYVQERGKGNAALWSLAKTTVPGPTAQTGTVGHDGPRRGDDDHAERPCPLPPRRGAARQAGSADCGVPDGLPDDDEVERLANLALNVNQRIQGWRGGRF
jgi:replicative DNA helicase